MKDRFLKQVKSFYYAIRGFLSVFVTESHMRFHLCTALFVLFFANKFYRLTSAQLAVLILTISSVFITEIVNTSIERLSDAVTKEYSKYIEFAKDSAAGAVLVAAITSIIVAFILLFDISVFKFIAMYYATHILRLSVLILCVVVALLFVAVKPESYLKLFKKDDTYKF